jgi:hypothetical protein
MGATGILLRGAGLTKYGTDDSTECDDDTLTKPSGNRLPDSLL